MPPGSARAPLDVDLEDRLVLGLTPVRFAYLAVGAVVAYTLGSHAGIAAAVRWPAAVLALAAGVALAWLRWHGRPLDAWIADITVHVRRNFEVQIDPGLMRRIQTPLRRPPTFAQIRQSRRPLPMIRVLGATAGAGATTVAVELGAALARRGRQIALQEAPGRADAALRLGLLGPGRDDRSGLYVIDGTDHPAPASAECVIVDLGHFKPTADSASSAPGRPRKEGSRPKLTVLVSNRDLPDPSELDEVARAVRASHLTLVVNQHLGEPIRPRTPADRDTEVAALVPQDPVVPIAQGRMEPVVLAFPQSRAARAFTRLADALDPPPARDSFDEDEERSPAG